MNNEQVYNQTIAQLRQALDQKKISAQELALMYLKRIEQYDSMLNSIITVTQEHALAAAKQADEKIKKGQVGPLTGIPILHKDIFCTTGIKTSCGSRMLNNFTSPYDATVVKKLKQAGTILLGKANMDEFAMGSSNENSYYGVVKNPWDLACVPGGSSGGSAAAVAARLTPGATGTDTGGSIRQPAAFCGITGMKPSYGWVSRYGMIAFASSLDQAGPMTKTAQDAALMLNAMAGFDQKDSTSVEQACPDFTATLNDDLSGLRIGLPKAFFNKDLDPVLTDIIHTAAKQFESLGATLVDIDLPHMPLAVPTYYVIAPAECSSNLARYDGVRYGYRCEKAKGLEDLYKRSRGEGFGTEVKRRIMIGTYVLSAGYYDAYYLKAQKIRRLIKNDFNAAFSQVDLILGPTTPSPAFQIGEKSDDPISMYLSDIYTIAANLVGLPAISIPAGFIEHKPIGLQLISNYFQDARLLNASHRFQQVTDWHLRQPDLSENAN